MKKLFFTLLVTLPISAFAGFEIDSDVVGHKTAKVPKAPEPVVSKVVTETKAVPSVAARAEPEKLAEKAAPPANQIKKGQPIHIALESWAKASGWTLFWYPTVSWKAIADVNMSHHNSVIAAVSDVVSILRDEGKPIQLRISEGNNVMEILSTEVKHD